MNKIEDLVPLLLDTLNNNKDFTMPVKGTSMLPFINEKNLVTLTKPNNIKKNDIVFISVIMDNVFYIEFIK